jgi:HD-GYP domain-containing protein (c-di-GMP phosphodiesterase class II)
MSSHGRRIEIIEPKTELQQVGEESKDPMDVDFLKMGNDLLVKIHALMKISQIYDSKNVTFQQFIQRSLQSINPLIKRKGDLSLKIVRENLFLNGERLHYSIEGFNSYKYLLTQWKKRWISEFIFRKPLDENTLKAYIFTLMGLEEGDQKNADHFNQQLERLGITWIEAIPMEDFGGEEKGVAFSREDQQKVAKKIYFESIRTVKDIITQIEKEQDPDIRKLKRLAQRTVYLMMKDESIMLGLTMIKNYDEYTFNHSVNVSIYAMAIGRQLGFSKKALTDLGITGFLHDIGKSKIPKEIINKPGGLNEAEWEIVKKHPLGGVEIILKLKQLGKLNPRIVVGIFDHHLKSSIAGYPKLFRKKKGSLFGRIIQIADVYDALTTSRIYRKTPATPQQALIIMLKEQDIQFDPNLLKIFIGLIGIYPIGSFVLLNTHEVGIVYRTNPDSQWIDRPQVVLVERGEKGDAIGKVIDLAEPDEKGQFKWNIVKTLNPHHYQIDIAKYFL